MSAETTAQAGIGSFYGQRAAEVDGVRPGEVSIHEGLTRAGLRHARDRGALAMAVPVAPQDAPVSIQPLMTVVRDIARECVSSAFSLWSQRMVVQYAARASHSEFPRDELLGRLVDVDLVGSTGLGTPMAHLLGAGPLTVSFRRERDSIVLNGRVNWASNLFPPNFILVTGAGDETGDPLIVAIPGDSPGIGIAPYPELLALQATGSSTVFLRDVTIPAANVVSVDFAGFLRGVRPVFLLLQSSLCWGLTAASLAAARGAIRGVNESFADDLSALHARLSELSERALTFGECPDAAVRPMRDFVQLRHEFAALAGEATRLDAAVQGGRGYATRCATARRFREAAFLPVQAPTEGQLRWELSHSV
ncbi:MAG: acyl-CoA dehydrogenase [Chloroflexota bacterium]|nr:MAG: acyl-CoA dehydrogenase [Chloroflexota bacterium]